MVRAAPIYAPSPPPGWRCAGLAPGPPAASGEVCGTITCHYDFAGNVYIFTITRPPSSIFHENWHEINDRATEETEHQPL